MKKRTLALILAAMLVLPLTASCANDNDSDETTLRDEAENDVKTNDADDADDADEPVSTEWSFADGVLTIGGGYKMEDLYDEDSDNFLDAPWNAHKDDIVKVVIENGCEYVGDASFPSYTNLNEVTLPDTVKAIGDAAFFGCTALNKVNIPEGVTAIGSYAFAQCTSLPAPTLPDSLTDIADHAFYNCDAFTSVNIPEGVQSIGDYAFEYSDALTAAAINNAEGAVELGNGVFPDGCVVTYTK